MLLKKLRQSQIQKESTVQKVQTPGDERVLIVNLLELIEASGMGIFVKFFFKDFMKTQLLFMKRVLVFLKCCCFPIYINNEDFFAYSCL